MTSQTLSLIQRGPILASKNDTFPGFPGFPLTSPPKQTKIQMTPNVCHFLQDSLAESRRKKTNVMCNFYPELWEVYHKKSLPKRQKCREKFQKSVRRWRNFSSWIFGSFCWLSQKVVKKKRGGYTVLDPDRQLVPARRHPKRKLKLIFQLPTIHLQVLFAFSFREGFFGVFQSFRRPNLSNQDAFAMHRKDATRNWWGKHVYCMPVSPQVAVSG